MVRNNKLIFEKAVSEIEAYIDANDLKSNEILPSERSLAERLKISRGTIREALTHMCNEGRLNNIQGKGRMISPQKCKINMQNEHSFSELVKMQGIDACSRLVSFHVEKANEYVASLLLINPSDNIYILSRVRMMENKEVLFEVSHIPEKNCPGLDLFDFEKKSLYEVLDRVYKLKVVRQEVTVSLAVPAEYEAGLLNLKNNDPIFIENGIAFSKDGTPVEYTKAFCNAKCGKYSIDISCTNT